MLQSNIFPDGLHAYDNVRYSIGIMFNMNNKIDLQVVILMNLIANDNDRIQKCTHILNLFDEGKTKFYLVNRVSWNLISLYH